MGEGARRGRGKIVPQPAVDDLVHVLLHHHAALEYDWTVRFGFGLAELVADRVTVTRAVALTAGVLVDQGSHTYAALHGWDRPMDEQTLILAQLLNRYIAAPETYPWPWKSPDRHATDEQVAAGIARLKARGPQRKG